MNTPLLKAARTVLKLGVGPREAVALGVIHALKGRAQVRDVKEALDATTPRASSIISVLKKKGLVLIIDNPEGWPFYKVTQAAINKINQSLK